MSASQPVDDYDHGLSNADKYEDQNRIAAGLVQRFMQRCGNHVRLLTAPGDSVVDIGAGEGRMTANLAALLPDRHLEALEHDVAAIEEFRRTAPSVKITQGTIYELPWPDDAFDVVTCFEVLEHLGDPDRALTELRRIARRHVVATVPYEPFFRMGNVARGKYVQHLGNTPGHLNHWGKRSFTRQLSRHFPVGEVTTVFPWLLATTAVRA